MAALGFERVDLLLSDLYLVDPRPVKGQAGTRTTGSGWNCGCWSGANSRAGSIPHGRSASASRSGAAICWSRWAVCLAAATGLTITRCSAAGNGAGPSLALRAPGTRGSTRPGRPVGPSFAAPLSLPKSDIGRCTERQHARAGLYDVLLVFTLGRPAGHAFDQRVFRSLSGGQGRPQIDICGACQARPVSECWPGSPKSRGHRRNVASRAAHPASYKGCADGSRGAPRAFRLPAGHRRQRQRVNLRVDRRDGRPRLCPRGRGQPPWPAQHVGCRHLLLTHPES
jgi:hypothetical protein